MILREPFDVMEHPRRTGLGNPSPQGGSTPRKEKQNPFATTSKGTNTRKVNGARSPIALNYLRASKNALTASVRQLKHGLVLH